MPWPGNACGTTTEFIELLNFGPGPMNIGCYILTDGDYSITIPANTILQPGQFYVISGTNTITYPCGNKDSTIHPHLNWTTCNCTSATIPVTGDGFMTDGGSASEQVVLLDPNLNVIDAVVRGLPPESSSAITTSTVGGQCTSRSFDLDTMNINYETIGESAGRGNSFARKIDGDCGWVKDTHESGNATNNTGGYSSSVTYSFYYLKSMACPNDGSIAVTVHASSYTDVFPMSYILAFDSDSDGVFETTDSYTYGSVTNPNSITIGNLIPGTYRLTLASVKGCYLHTFPFTILKCFIALPVKLISFTAQKNSNDIRCNWVIDHVEQLKDVFIERSADGFIFSPFTMATVPGNINGTWNNNYRFTETLTTLPFFRLRMISKSGRESFSSVINITSNESVAIRIWPNPATSQVNINFSFPSTGIAEVAIYNISNCVVMKKLVPVQAGNTVLSIPIEQLPPGIYQLSVQSKSMSGLTRWFRFVKQ